MEELYILIYGYDNENSTNPNALCIYELISKFSLHYKVTLITTTFNKEYYFLEYNGVEIHYIPLSTKKNKKYNFKKWELKVLELFSKKKLNAVESTLLTISFPFDILRVGLKVKKRYAAIKWIVYELDPFAYNLVLRFNKSAFIYRFYLENQVFKHCNAILLTHELYRQYSDSFYSKYNNKFNDVGIPLLKILSDKKKESNKNNIDIVYIGSFYKNIREPDYMFKIFTKLIEKNRRIRLHLYGPPIDSISLELRNQYKENIICYGRVPKDVVMGAIGDADVLINIGNSISNQLPSKLLEYIGTGKPIINFYRINNDTSNQYLSKYPLSCLVYEDLNKIDGNTNFLNNFIMSNYYKSIDESVLRLIYEADILENISENINRIVANNQILK